jgi:hypothetical protein
MVQETQLTADFNAKNLEKIVCLTRALTQRENCPGSDAVCKLLSTMDNSEFGDDITDSV